MNIGAFIFLLKISPRIFFTPFWTDGNNRIYLGRLHHHNWNRFRIFVIFLTYIRTLFLVYQLQQFYTGNLTLTNNEGVLLSRKVVGSGLAVILHAIILYKDEAIVYFLNQFFAEHKKSGEEEACSKLWRGLDLTLKSFEVFSVILHSITIFNIFRAREQPGFLLSSRFCSVKYAKPCSFIQTSESLLDTYIFAGYHFGIFQIGFIVFSYLVITRKSLSLQVHRWVF